MLFATGAIFSRKQVKACPRCPIFIIRRKYGCVSKHLTSVASLVLPATGAPNLYQSIPFAAGGRCFPCFPNDYGGTEIFCIFLSYSCRKYIFLNRGQRVQTHYCDLFVDLNNKILFIYISLHITSLLANNQSGKCNGKIKDEND